MSILGPDPRTTSAAADGHSLNQYSPVAAKIALFRSLFRGREDVYPRRFESRKTGKSGYAPACANEWVQGICEKPRIKCAVCPHRRFLPVTDEVIRWHLSGRDASDLPFVAGVYPLLLDETCFFLTVDFDKHGWQSDSIAFLRGCRRLGLTAALERSRSGRGGHAWLFFEHAVPAALARRLGSHLLTEAMEDRPDIGLDSYDRLFPSQDTMPQGGFGNLIALPLQRGPRDQGNSVFVDDDLVPWPDQWAFLAGVRRLGRTEVEAIVQEAERQPVGSGDPSRGSNRSRFRRRTGQLHLRAPGICVGSRRSSEGGVNDEVRADFVWTGRSCSCSFVVKSSVPSSEILRPSSLGR
jgi:hypothetical protein